MDTRNHFWRFGLQFCLNCGSFFPEDGGLCQYCRDDLWDWVHQEALYHRDQGEYEILSLLEWVPGWQETLSRLILSLKGTRSEGLWRHYAAEFWRRHLVGESSPSVLPRLLVPSPPRNQHQDHAGAFTLALAEFSGGLVYPCLRRANLGKSQRKKRRYERARARFEWAENFTPEDFLNRAQGRQIVFVDDIVTSGFTARAAWKILGEPREFAVWSLAQRSLPCGP